MSFLLDENVAAPLADKLENAGHDVARVVDVSELGEGVDDTAIRRYAVSSFEAEPPALRSEDFRRQSEGRRE